MYRHRNRLGIILSVALAAELLGAAGPVAAARAAPVIVAGTFLDGHGVPVRHGAVILYLTRMDHVAIDAPLVALGTTNGRGAFRLVARNEAALAAAAAANDGWVNLHVVGVSGDAAGSVSVARRWDGLRWSRSGARRVRLRTARPLAPAERRNLPRLMGAAAERDGVPSDAWEANGLIFHDNPYCIRHNDAYTNEYTIVGELHTWSDVAASFSYGSTSDSDISVGISANGGSSWSLGGEVHVGTSTSNTITRTVGQFFGRTIRSGFEYVRYTYTGTFCYDGFTYFNPVRWTGGVIDGRNVDSRDGRCAQDHPGTTSLFGNGTTFDRSSADFTKFSAAASVFGAKVKAQSGASSNVKVHYEFGSAVYPHRLCGDTNYPLYSKRIFAGVP